MDTGTSAPFCSIYRPEARCGTTTQIMCHNKSIPPAVTNKNCRHLEQLVLQEEKAKYLIGQMTFLRREIVLCGLSISAKNLRDAF